MTLFAGTSEPASIMAGANEVQAVYAGSTEVWSKGAGYEFVGDLTFTGDNDTNQGWKFLKDIYPNTDAGPQIHSIAGIKQGDFVLMFLTCMQHQPRESEMGCVTPGSWLKGIGLGDDWNGVNGSTYGWAGVWPGGGKENNPYWVAGRELRHRHVMKVLVFRGPEKVVFASLKYRQGASVNVNGWNWPTNATCPDIPAVLGPCLDVCGFGSDGPNWHAPGNIAGKGRGPAGFEICGGELSAGYTDRLASISTAFSISEDGAARSPGLYVMDGLTADTSANINAFSIRLGKNSARSVNEIRKAVRNKVKDKVKEKLKDRGAR